MLKLTSHDFTVKNIVHVNLSDSIEPDVIVVKNLETGTYSGYMAKPNTIIEFVAHNLNRVNELIVEFWANTPIAHEIMFMSIYSKTCYSPAYVSIVRKVMNGVTVQHFYNCDLKAEKRFTELAMQTVKTYENKKLTFSHGSYELITVES